MKTKNDIIRNFTIELTDPNLDIAMKDAILSGETRAKNMEGDYKLKTITLMKIQAKYTYATDKLKSIYTFKAVYSESHQ